MLHDGKVASTFPEMFDFWFFLLHRFVLGKYVSYKISSSDFALSNKKKLDWFRSQQYGQIDFDIFVKTFASHFMFWKKLHGSIHEVSNTYSDKVFSSPCSS
jgi:hypothetical protein